MVTNAIAPLLLTTDKAVFRAFEFSPIFSLSFSLVSGFVALLWFHFLLLGSCEGIPLQHYPLCVAVRSDNDVCAAAWVMFSSFPDPRLIWCSISTLAGWWGWLGEISVPRGGVLEPSRYILLIKNKQWVCNNVCRFCGIDFSATAKSVFRKFIYKVGKSPETVLADCCSPLGML